MSGAAAGRRIAARLPRLRTILLVSNLVLLALPLGGIWLLRIYESALIRQTESELIAQAAALSAAYKQAWLSAAGDGAHDALAGQPRASAGPASRHPPGVEERREPLFANLDLADDPILPLPPAAAPPSGLPERFAAEAGQRLQPVLRDTQALTLAAIRVVDRAGTVVASTGEELGLSLARQTEIETALSGLPISTFRKRVQSGERPALSSISRAAELRVFVAVPAVEGDRVLGAVMVSRTPRTLDQALYHKRRELGWLLGVLLAAGAAFAGLVALTVTRPIREIVGQARRVAAGERGAVAPLRGRYSQEVADLSASLATMAQTLEARADYIRDFAAEVSHEFKTPLAAMKGATELLRDHLDDMAPEERRRFLANLEEDVARLERLVRRLLELARADVLRPTGAETADVGEVVARIVARFRAQGLALRLEAGAPPATLAAVAPAALETALANLLDNVRQHAGPAAAATVSVGEGRDHGGARCVLVRVADQGPGVTPGNAGRVFDRFFTTARDRGGDGLGLPIARSHLAAYGGDIALLPSARGAAFEIRLPPAARLEAAQDPARRPP